MHPRTGRQRAYWACAGRLAKAVTAPATISTDWRMACSLEVFRATLMYERVHAPFKAPDSGMIGPEMQVGGELLQIFQKRPTFAHLLKRCCKFLFVLLSGRSSPVTLVFRLSPQMGEQRLW